MRTQQRRDFTYRWFILIADGAAAAVQIYSRFSVMNSRLLPEEKLVLLRTADSRRKWHSLDDQRVCVLCHRTITGRQIEVIRDAGGAVLMRCPTEGCPALPSDWFYHGSAYSGHRDPAGRNDEASFLWK